MRTSRFPWMLGGLSVVLAVVLVGLTLSGPAPSAERQPAVATTPASTTPGATPSASPPTPPSASPTPPRPRPAGTRLSLAGLRVLGNTIVNEDGFAVRLLGFNSSGAE